MTPTSPIGQGAVEDILLNCCPHSLASGPGYSVICQECAMKIVAYVQDLDSKYRDLDWMMASLRK